MIIPNSLERREKERGMRNREEGVWRNLRGGGGSGYGLVSQISYHMRKGVVEQGGNWSGEVCE